MDKNQNIVHYKKNFHLNIGIVIFAFVLIYFVVYLISYLTGSHTAVYEVRKGQIVQNTSYTGLVLRAEEVTPAPESGEVNYYAKEGDKAGYQSLVCSIDKNGDISREITQAGLNGEGLSAEDLGKIQDKISDYSKAYSAMQFYHVYSFKDSINAEIQENLYVQALEQLSAQTDTAVSQNTFSFIRTAADGVLAFYTDGYEDVTPDSFTAQMYDPGSYRKTNLKSLSVTEAGNPLYKMVRSEDWYIMVPISEADTLRYQQELGEGQTSFVIRTLFKKDHTSAYATAVIRELEGQNFLQLKYNSSMVRFLSDRYLEIELGSNHTTGLKIPNSAITQKEFFVIPKSYIAKGDNSTDNGVILISGKKGGTETAEFVPTQLYYETEEAYYIDEEELQAGDVIQMQGSTERFTIQDTASLEGVYNMNKGYAVFRQIRVLAQNEEYTIVDTGTPYGISMYDHIALDGTSIREGEMANK